MYRYRRAFGVLIMSVDDVTGFLNTALFFPLSLYVLSFYVLGFVHRLYMVGCMVDESHSSIFSSIFCNQTKLFSHLYYLFLRVILVLQGRCMNDVAEIYW